ncbi:sulfotransferase [Paenibacillus sp. V4I7]|uniref:sulfotransferase n=1 Tax=Paenibacillus sp. V4I7 TaxID=3042307 RepID=UPI0027819ED6|nr:sulfotransferase [Paenibacillus sp. V4I7]MDQ0897550.1 hypothetical protein [Paenibacillus sp. V4I7]
MFAAHFTEIVHAVRDIPDERFLYQAIQLAAAQALGRIYDFKKGIPVIVEGGIHFGTNIEQTRRLVQLFPAAKLIHAVRDPVIAFASAMNYQLRSGHATVYNLCYQLYSLFQAVPAYEQWIERTYVVRLEDLHTRSLETLQLICGCLDIGWSDTLLISTFGGKKWWNTLTSEVLSGFTTRTISKTYDELLTQFDKLRFRIMLRSKYDSWGYPINDETETLEKPIEDLLELPFAFEKEYARDELTLKAKNKIIRKLLRKQMSIQIPYERKVHVLSPEMLVSI